MIARRTFIAGASALVASATGLSPGSAEPAPNSSGSENAKLKAPPGARDCHHHIYDPARFPPSRPQVQQVPNARLEDYRLPAAPDRIQLQHRSDARRPIRRRSADPMPRRSTCSSRSASMRAASPIVYPGITDAELKSLDAWRHPRHPLRAHQRAARRRQHRSPRGDRSLVQTGERARLACAVQHHRRPDRGVGGSSEPPGLADRVRSHGAHSPAGRPRSPGRRDHPPAPRQGPRLRQAVGDL